MVKMKLFAQPIRQRNKMESKFNAAKTQLVFKLEQKPDGYGQVFSQNCKITIERTDGPLYLNYDKRQQRVMGFFNNLRQEGEAIIADIRLLDTMMPIEDRLEYAIEGAISKRNEKDEAEEVKIKGVSALMHNKF